jgi:hypothetical protein
MKRQIRESANLPFLHIKNTLPLQIYQERWRDLALRNLSNLHDSRSVKVLIPTQWGDKRNQYSYMNSIS